jgi:hypothetical protein
MANSAPPPRVAAERSCRAFHNSPKRFPPLRLLRARRPLTGDAESVNSTRHAGWLKCGYDVVAACQLPKLNARVRFPLPAPISQAAGGSFEIGAPKRSDGRQPTIRGMFRFWSAPNVVRRRQTSCRRQLRNWSACLQAWRLSAPDAVTRRTARFRPRPAHIRRSLTAPTDPLAFRAPAPCPPSE